MAKLKEKDKRSSHRYQVGDIVRLHPSVRNMNLPGDGMVLQIDGEITKDNKTHQQLNCCWAAREVDLWKQAKDFSLQRVTDMTYFPPQTIKIESHKVIHVKNRVSWLKCPSSKEISTFRFSALLDDLL